jgi:hypothetical protein
MTQHELAQLLLNDNHCNCASLIQLIMPVLLTPFLAFTLPRRIAAVSDALLGVERIEQHLLWFCVMVMLRFRSHAPVFLAFPPPPPLLFALNLPSRLAAIADALLGVVNSDVLLL